MKAICICDLMLTTKTVAVASTPCAFRRPTSYRPERSARRTNSGGARCSADADRCCCSSDRRPPLHALGALGRPSSAAAALGSAVTQLHLAGSAAAASAAASSAQDLDAAESTGHVIGWVPALVLLAASWQAPRVAAAAADFLVSRCYVCSGFALDHHLLKCS